MDKIIPMNSAKELELQPADNIIPEKDSVKMMTVTELHEHIQKVGTEINRFSKSFILVSGGTDVQMGDGTENKDVYIVTFNAWDDEELYKLVEKMLLDPAMQPFIHRFFHEMSVKEQHKIIAPPEQLIH